MFAFSLPWVVFVVVVSGVYFPSFIGVVGGKWFGEYANDELVGLSSELNVTNFLHTVPPLPACVGWDDATTTRQPVGKSVEEVQSLVQVV